MKPVLKPPGSMILKVRDDGPLSSSAFEFNLRRYIKAKPGAKRTAVLLDDDDDSDVEQVGIAGREVPIMPIFFAQNADAEFSGFERKLPA